MSEGKRVVLVTGGSRGIGAATAQAFAEAGYAVAVNYRSESTAAEAVVARLGEDSAAFRANVAEPAEVIRLFEAVDERFGRLDVLVNNAGIIGPRTRIEGLTPEALTEMLAVNVSGPILCSQQAIARMSTRHGGNGGCIVNVSSGSAYIGNAGNGVHYAVTRGALNSFTIGASQELVAEGIRVNAVSPGMTRTDMIADRPPEMFAGLPMGRAGEPGEIAAAILWLASDAASYVAGANIRVAGGRP